MMTAAEPVHTRRGSMRHLTAIHEAGHAVTHLLLGHHVIAVEINAGYRQISRGNTSYMSVYINGFPLLPDLVGTAAGEAAVLRYLNQETHPDPESFARATGGHDREHTAQITDGTTVPPEIGKDLAAPILADRWAAVERVADALCQAPDGRLDQHAVLAAADLGDTEIDWDTLASMAEATMPDNPGLRAYLNGPALQEELACAALFRELHAYGVLHSRATATRRRINAEIYNRGPEKILAVLRAALGGG